MRSRDINHSRVLAVISCSGGHWPMGPLKSKDSAVSTEANGSYTVARGNQARRCHLTIPHLRWSNGDGFTKSDAWPSGVTEERWEWKWIVTSGFTDDQRNREKYKKKKKTDYNYKLSDKWKSNKTSVFFSWKWRTFYYSKDPFIPYEGHKSLMDLKNSSWNQQGQ